MYLLHQNETGSFQELAHASDVEFGQLSLLTVAPRRTRGGHYHTRKKEWFCCIHGKCYLAITDVRDNWQKSFTLCSDNREFVRVNPYEAHIVLNPSDAECELLVICSEEFGLDSVDTIKYEKKGEPVCQNAN